MRTFTTLEGNSQRLDGGAMFGNAPKALWSRWVDTDEQNRIALSCRALLVQEDDRNILIETGIRSEEHTSELQSRPHLVCRLLLEKKKKQIKIPLVQNNK